MHVTCILRRTAMGTDFKYKFSKPKQIPLFEEQDDGSLQEFKKEN